MRCYGGTDVLQILILRGISNFSPVAEDLAVYGMAQRVRIRRRVCCVARLILRLSAQASIARWRDCLQAKCSCCIRLFMMSPIPLPATPLQPAAVVTANAPS